MDDLMKRCIAAIDAVEIKIETDDWVGHFFGTELANFVQDAIARAIIPMVREEAALLVERHVTCCPDCCHNAEAAIRAIGAP